jgi:hypothetical protein
MNDYLEALRKELDYAHRLNKPAKDIDAEIKRVEKLLLAQPDPSVDGEVKRTAKATKAKVEKRG